MPYIEVVHLLLASMSQRKCDCIAYMCAIRIHKAKVNVYNVRFGLKLNNNDVCHGERSVRFELLKTQFQPNGRNDDWINFD